MKTELQMNDKSAPTAPEVGGAPVTQLPVVIGTNSPSAEQPRKAATERQRKANRRNSLRSTGPKSKSGKAASAANSRKHGLLATEILLPDEDYADWEKFETGILDSIKPVGQLELELAKRIAAMFWRLRRATRVDTGIFRTDFYQRLASRAEHEADKCTEKVWLEYEKTEDEDENFDNEMSGGGEWKTKVRDQVGYERAKERVSKACADRDDIAHIPSQTFAAAKQSSPKGTRDDDVFARIARYEGALERSLYRALHELQRLQALRFGQKVLAPIAVDVSGESDDHIVGGNR